MLAELLLSIHTALNFYGGDDRSRWDVALERILQWICAVATRGILGEVRFVARAVHQSLVVEIIYEHIL